MMILGLPPFLSMNATGLQSRDERVSTCRRHHVGLILSAVSAQPMEAKRTSGFLERLGEQNLAKDVTQALALAEKYLQTSRPSH